MYSKLIQVYTYMYLSFLRFSSAVELMTDCWTYYRIPCSVLYIFIQYDLLLFMYLKVCIVYSQHPVLSLATWCKELTHLKRPWCWKKLKAGKGDDRGWDGWMASPTRWTWVWVSSGSWWWTGRPGMLQSRGRKESDMTEQLNWLTDVGSFQNDKTASLRYCIPTLGPISGQKHYFISVWDECNCAVVWAFFGIAFLWDWVENWPFPVL